MENLKLKKIEKQQIGNLYNKNIRKKKIIENSKRKKEHLIAKFVLGKKQILTRNVELQITVYINFEKHAQKNIQLILISMVMLSVHCVSIYLLKKENFQTLQFLQINLMIPMISKYLLQQFKIYFLNKILISYNKDGCIYYIFKRKIKKINWSKLFYVLVLKKLKTLIRKPNSKEGQKERMRIKIKNKILKKIKTNNKIQIKNQRRKKKKIMIMITRNLCVKRILKKNSVLETINQDLKFKYVKLYMNMKQHRQLIKINRQNQLKFHAKPVNWSSAHYAWILLIRKAVKILKNGNKIFKKKVI